MTAPVSSVIGFQEEISQSRHRNPTPCWLHGAVSELVLEPLLNCQLKCQTSKSPKNSPHLDYHLSNQDNDATAGKAQKEHTTCVVGLAQLQMAGVFRGKRVSYCHLQPC